MADGNQLFLDMFNDPDAITRYAEGPPRFTPGFEALHRMSAILLAEHMPVDGHLLVLGAGGGLELKAFAAAQPGWRFTGVDPAGPMLDLARVTMGSHADRATLIEGKIDAAPDGPFDGATCLLTLHFLPRDARTQTLREMRRRMKPGAPLVVAHSSFPQDEPARARWLDRYAAYALASGADPAQVEQARAAVGASLALLTPEQDEACLRDAGFDAVDLFYAAFTWRGWTARA
ncbi:class I SAM-dependent methyltransferase [Sphingomonas baiyangensis]|uniref:Methyltransferase domain-containing protein n=1 Tax=Sphingomonas baiyangensis TaxID=2572576 RepID=A0A4V5PVB2_9SPHN|nr:class I SAM-dependent methyltransferase [Sphingomonas baiyangensis]TKD53318.1 methyltransferase domain-containing protein [Sphingomonas baiyangensis]